MKKNAWGIQTKLLVLVGFILILPVILFLFLTHRLESGVVRTHTGAYFQEMAEMAASLIQNSIDAEIKKLQSIPLSPKTHAALETLNAWDASAGETPPDTEELSLLLNHYLISEPGLYRELGLFDARGRVAASTRKKAESNWTESAWWKKMEQTGKPVWFLEKMEMETQIAPLLYWHVAVPIYTPNPPRMIGVIYAVMNFQPLLDFLKDVQLGQSGKITFVASQEKLSLSAPYGALSEMDSWLGGLQDQNQKSGWEIDPGPNGEPVIRGFAQVLSEETSRDTMPSPSRWWIVVEQSLAESLIPLIPYRYAAIGAILLLLIALFYIAVGVIRSIARPLRKLRESAKLTELGMVDFSVNTDRGDELGELARSLQQLALHLKNFKDESAAKSRSLAQLNTELERQNRLKGNFISLVSHELRTPLTTLSGYVKFLNDGKAGNITHEQHDCLNAVDKQIRHLSYLIEQLLHVSRIESGKQEVHAAPVYLPGVVHDCVSGATAKAAAKEIKIENRIGENFPLVFADRNHLVQIFTNLLDNALKYTPRGGKITLGGEDRGEFLEFCLKDSGQGIPPEFQQKIFEKFFRLEEGKAGAESGLGLGLAIVKDLLELNGGRIWLKSSMGKGSEFYFLLPKYSRMPA